MTQFPQRHSSSLQGRLIPPQGPSTRVFPPRWAARLCPVLRRPPALRPPLPSAPSPCEAGAALLALVGDLPFVRSPPCPRALGTSQGFSSRPSFTGHFEGQRLCQHRGSGS